MTGKCKEPTFSYLAVVNSLPLNLILLLTLQSETIFLPLSLHEMSFGSPSLAAKACNTIPKQK